MGNHLRKLPLRIKSLGSKGTRKKIDPNVQKKDGKVIKSKQIAKRRLSDALIDRLHNYFGIALRSNAKSELKPEPKPELKQVFLASMFHAGRLASLDSYKMVNVKPAQYTTACHSMNISQKYNKGEEKLFV